MPRVLLSLRKKTSQTCQWLALSAHTHSCKHTALFLSASDSTQPLLFLFHRLIAPTEDHWFYGKPCLQAECHRPEVTFCLLLLEQYRSTLMSALAVYKPEYLVHNKQQGCAWLIVWKAMLRGVKTNKKRQCAYNIMCIWIDMGLWPCWYFLPSMKCNDRIQWLIHL